MSKIDQEKNRNRQPARRDFVFSSCGGDRPNSGGRRILSKQWVTDDLSNLGTQIEFFKEQYARYSTTEEGLGALVHKPSDPAEKWVQQILIFDPDPWGRPYQFCCAGRRNPKNFDLYAPRLGWR